MNAPFAETESRPVAPLVDILSLMAQSAASSCELFGLDLAGVVDPLQEFAQQTGLVAAIGQDAVQEIIEEPFAWLFGAPPPITASVSPPFPEPAPRPYRTPQSTIDAFLWVARNEAPEYLADWLEQHPRDVATLREVWSQKCIAP